MISVVILTFFFDATNFNLSKKALVSVSCSEIASCALLKDIPAVLIPGPITETTKSFVFNFKVPLPFQKPNLQIQLHHREPEYFS
jgi:hypothetical protein